MLLNEFTEFLTESAHGTLFHVTKLPAMISILDKQSFELGFSLAKTNAEQFRPAGTHKYFYLSTARSPTSGFIAQRRFSGDAQVLIEMNGDWFNKEGYVTKPVDYFGGKGSDEMEDRVYSLKPEISFEGEASNLIKALHIKIPSNSKNFVSMGRETVERMLKVMIQAKKLGIPFYVYTNATAWLMRATDKAMDPKMVVAVIKADLEDTPIENKFNSEFNPSAQSHKGIINSKREYKALLNLITAKKASDILEDTFNIIDGESRYNTPDAIIKDMFFKVKHNLGTPAVQKLAIAIKKSGMNPDTVWKTLTDKWMGMSYGLEKHFAQSSNKQNDDMKGWGSV